MPSFIIESNRIILKKGEKKMKQTTKKMRYLLWGTILVLAAAAVFAVIWARAGLRKPTDLFCKVCDGLFSQTENYIALDEQQNDVTQTFVSEYADAYNRKDYDTLWQAVREELYAVAWQDEREEKQGDNTKRQAEKKYYVLDCVGQGINAVTFEMLYRINTDLTKQGSDLAEISGPVFNIDVFHAGNAYDYQIKEVTGGDDGKRAEVEFTIELKAKYGIGKSAEESRTYRATLEG